MSSGLSLDASFWALVSHDDFRPQTRQSSYSAITRYAMLRRVAWSLGQGYVSAAWPRVCGVMVKRRAVFHIAGYDPIGAAWYRLLKRELVTFTRTWNVRSAVSDPRPGAEDVSTQWTVTTRARNWRVETAYEALLWDDIVLDDYARPTGTRLARSVRAFLDIIVSGAARRYFRANWQYGFFFFIPTFCLARSRSAQSRSHNG